MLWLYFIFKILTKDLESHLMVYFIDHFSSFVRFWVNYFLFYRCFKDVLIWNLFCISYIFRTKERAEALVRMRNRRSDPEYRERERARDRQRRKLARQKNLIQRQEERTRDRMYKQRRRTNLIQDSQLPQTSNVMSSEFVDAEDISQNVTDIETSRDSAILECANDLDFQVVEVYNEMEVKVEQCVEAYSWKLLKKC